MFTDYNPSAKSRSDLLIELIKGNHYNIQVNLAQNDEVVGNRYNKELVDLYNQKKNNQTGGYSDEQIKNKECFYCNEDLDGHNEWIYHLFKRMDNDIKVKTSDYVKPVDWKTVFNETKLAKKIRFVKKGYVSINKIFNNDTYQPIFEYLAQDKNIDNWLSLKNFLTQLNTTELLNDNILNSVAAICKKGDSAILSLKDIDQKLFEDADDLLKMLMILLKN